MCVAINPILSPRALDEIFQLLPPHTTSTVCVSYIEVYRDELRDLFVGVATEGGDVTGERGVTIREDSHGNIRKCCYTFCSDTCT